jgi:hypothetical protein
VYRYYVSFSYQAPSGLGIASLDVTTQSRISKVDDLASVTPQIADQGYRNVKILAFSLYAQERPNPNTRPSRGGDRR